MNSFLTSFWELTLSMAPYLLLGFGIAGLLHAFVPAQAYHHYLARPGFRSVFNAALLGVPLPLCSCGVLPTTVSLRRSGASRGACTSFLIATPQTGVDSILATYSLLGLPFAILRPVAALVTGVLGGVVTDRLFRNDRHSMQQEKKYTSANPSEEESRIETLTFLGKCRKAVTYAFGELLEDVGRWLFIGLLIAALITTAIPDGFFSPFQQWPLLNMLLMLLLAIPMYVCATGSIPIALSLMLKGMTPGAAFVLLMAGPAINAASILVIDKAFGRKQTVVYLSTIVAGALSFGLLMDYLLPAGWFTLAVQHAANGAECHNESASWWQMASAILLVGLLIRALYHRFFSKHTCGCQDNCSPSCACTNQTSDAGIPTLLLKVNGTRCHHCARNVEEALASLPFVAHVEVNLTSGEVQVMGKPNEILEETIIRNKIKEAGYSVE